jgi:hypothetical protein
MVLFNTVIHSQGISDALRYSQDNLNGTARFSAMSGAFGALGGDLSSLNINPAGSAIFSNNQMAVTLSNNSTKNNSNYVGTTSSDSNNSFDLNQAGGVFIFKTQDPKNDWKKISLAINYDKTNNFDNALFSEGTNPENSVADYFLSYANQNGGQSLSNFQLQPNETISDLYSYLGSNANLGFGTQQAFLGYQGYIINPIDGTNLNNTLYTSNVPSGGNYYQKNSISANGYNGKLSFNAATSYKDKIYLGINLNSHFTDYTQSSSFYEDNDTPLTSEYTVSKLRFDNYLHTYGTGFSFQIGAIAKASKEIRLGLAYESQTWYILNDELSQNLSAVRSKTGANDTDDRVNPEVTNIYAPYKLQSPSKWTGSFAYIFGKIGLVSIDYAIKDYSNTQFKPKNEFSNTNTSMANLLNQSGEFRIGGEYKIDAWSLRAGYRFEQSPYKDKNTMGNLTGFSSGIGYNFGATKLDLSYTATHRDSNQFFFNRGFSEGADINTTTNTITATLLFEL